MKNDSNKNIGRPIFLRGKKDAGLVFFHGWSAIPGEFSDLAKFLNEQGYWVYVPMLSGHGTKPEDLLNIRWQDWKRDAVEAVFEMKKYVRNIVVGGISIGGALAMMISNDSSVRAILSLGAPYRFRFHYLAKLAVFLMSITKTYRSKYYPKRVRELSLKRVSYQRYPVKNLLEVFKLVEENARFLHRVKKPIIIMQSETDHIISKNSAKNIFEKVSSQKKELVLMGDVYHVFISTNGKEKAQAEIKKFLEKVL